MARHAAPRRGETAPTGAPRAFHKAPPRPHGAAKALLVGCCAVMISACASHRGAAGEGQTYRDDHAVVPEAYRFADLGGEQLASAQRYGLPRPIARRSQVRRKARRLKRVRSCEAYLVDPLTHSSPYLTRGARSLLEDIAGGFQYVLRRQGYRKHRIIVTSLLRTEEDVASLRRVNGNAARRSAHLYATTFDISYTRFNRLSTDGRPVGGDEMARILAIVIGEFRDRGECVVIYERNQHCFHVTVRR